MSARTHCLLLSVVLVVLLLAVSATAQLATTTTLSGNPTSVTYPATVTFTGTVAPFTSGAGSGVPSGDLTIAGPGGPLSAPLSLVPATESFNFTALATGNTIPSLNSFQSVAAADFSGDGIPDLAISFQNDIATGGVTVLLGPGPGFQTTYAGLAYNSVLSQMVVGDFNGDGKMDVAGDDIGTSSSNFGQIVFVLNGDTIVPTTTGPCNPDSTAGCFLTAGRYHEAAPTHDDVVFTDHVNIYLLTEGLVQTALVLPPAVGNCTFTPALLAPGMFTASGHLDLIVIGNYQVTEVYGAPYRILFGAL
jgi:hypothetical protein